MGIPIGIKTLLEGNVVEWARIEFKKTWKPEESLRTICAFANDIDNWGGGYLVIGVEEDNGRPVLPVTGVPLEKIDSVLKDILNKCKMIAPSYLPVVAPMEYQGKMLIVAWAPGGEVRPYNSPEDFYYENHKAKPTKERVYFIRKMSSTVKPSQDELNELYSLSNKVPFDDRINHEAELSDLNLNLIRQYLTTVGSSMVNDLDSKTIAEICEDMVISNNLPEYRKPRNVGLMFFSNEPDKFFPYAQIDVVAFPQGLGGDVIDERTFKGPLDQQLIDALRYIKNCYIQRRIIKRPGRAEADHIYNYPYEAIEEALANAVYHKAYDEREPIEVRIDDEKIEILSFPGPVHSVTKEQLKNYKVTNRRYRNRRIGDFLKDLHLTEGRNTGFKKILDAIKLNGSPLPEFETDDDHTYFISRFYVHEEFAKKAEGNESVNAETGSVNETVSKENDTVKAKNDTVNPKSETVNRKNDTVNLCIDNIQAKLLDYSKVKKERAERIISEMLNNEQITIPEISQNTGIAVSTLKRYIAELKENEIIAREGSDKNGRWIILL